MEKTTTQEALEILEAIPAEDWMTGEFVNSDGSRSCALGWYARKKYPELEEITSDFHKKYYENNELFWERTMELRNISSKFINAKYSQYGDIAIVNNLGGHINSYTEPKIKDRVIHLLKDMIEAGY